jgi:hypothetical protein
MDKADMELAAFEDPADLEDVPVDEEPVSDDVDDVLDSDQVIETLGESGIPKVALDAYNDAADVESESDPGCGIHWSLLAAIGRVESNHGRFGGAKLRADGSGTKPILGIPLDGRRHVALIRDTDDGALDGDRTFDRAVGPMQFIPSTWRSVGQDGNDDGRNDPNNMFDATQGAGAYLCAGNAHLDDMAGQAAAVRRYNNADSYVRVVLRLATMYETGHVEPLPDLPVPPPASTPSSPRPPAPRPSTPTVPAPKPTTPTTVPAPTPTTAPPTTVPPTPTTTAPPVTTPAPTTTTTVPRTTSTTVVTEPPPGTEPPAAVGWAPAMRQVVVGILHPDPCPPPTSPTSSTTTSTTVPPEASTEPPKPDGC